MERWNIRHTVRLVMCMGQHCNSGGRAEAMYERMREELGAPANYTCRKLVRWERANCLSNCDIGPNFVFYPQGLWFHQATLDSLDEILRIYREEQAALGEE